MPENAATPAAHHRAIIEADLDHHVIELVGALEPFLTAGRRRAVADQTIITSVGDHIAPPLAVADCPHRKTRGRTDHAVSTKMAAAQRENSKRRTPVTLAPFEGEARAAKRAGHPDRTGQNRAAAGSPPEGCDADKRQLAQAGPAAGRFDLRNIPGISLS